MANIITTQNNVKVRELMYALMDELGVPRDLVAFEVRFAADEPVTVKTEFYAKQKDQIQEP